jgi:hypothetical protein
VPSLTLNDLVYRLKQRGPTRPEDLAASILVLMRQFAVLFPSESLVRVMNEVERTWDQPSPDNL